MSYTTKEVIDWYLAKESMTQKKLQKILYYAYAWYLTLQNEDQDHLDQKLFKNNFEAWVHGPVIPNVYHAYKNNGYNEIPKHTGEVAAFDQDTLDILEQVWDVYGGYNGNELESITHQEDPWLNARKGYGPLDKCTEQIEDKEIFDYYLQRLN